MKTSIARKLILFTVLFSSLITLATTAIQLYFEYGRDINNINVRLDNIRTSNLDSIAEAVWVADNHQLQIMLDGIRELPDIQYVEVLVNDEGYISSGKMKTGSVVTRETKLVYEYLGKQLTIGHFKVVATLYDVYLRLLDRIWIILVSNGVKTFLVALFIYYIFTNLVTKHLSTISAYTSNLRFTKDESPLVLNRMKNPAKKDELDILEVSINNMREKILSTLNSLTESESELKAHRDNLELKVQERTRDLNESLQNLQHAQNRLVENEKMAALGGLVAGVAHEINTPVGIGVTAASHLDVLMKEYKAIYESGNLTRGDFRELISNASEVSQLILSNLERAADLIRSFKQIAVDQTDDSQLRTFNLKDYINEILTNLQPSFKNTKHKVNVICDNDVELYNNPGAFYQIITNLVMNSLIHGFEGVEEGQISIEVESVKEAIHVSYNDNGVGIEEKNISKIFFPFFTTKRNNGSSGLGMHIVFNLVSQMFGGDIQCRSEKGHGVTFQITIPTNDNHSERSSVDKCA